MYPRAEATPLWFEPDYEDLVDIDTIDIEDPSPSPEDMYATLEAWSVRRHAMERAYGPARPRTPTEERGRAEELELAAARRDAAARHKERLLELARREDEKREHEASKQRFVDDRERLVQLAEERAARGWGTGGLSMEHIWAKRFVEFARQARTPGASRRGHEYHAVMNDGSIYVIMAKGPGAARGALLLDTKTVAPNHQRPPFDFRIEDHGRYYYDGLSGGLPAEVVGMASRAWRVPIKNGKNRTLTCIVAAPTEEQAVQAVVDDVEVQDEWKADTAFMRAGLAVLPEEDLFWMRTSNEYLSTLLTDVTVPTVLGILNEKEPPRERRPRNRKLAIWSS